MLPQTDLVLFLAASLVVILAPGPDNVLVLTRGVVHGRNAALVSAAGASLGLVIHSCFAAVGLSALLAQSAVAFSVVKYVGAAYLVYLGVRALLDREGFALTPGEAPVGTRKVFVQAVASNVLNPKIAVFFLAYLPQFADPTAGRPALQLLVLGLVFAMLTLALFSALGLFSGTVGSWLRTRPTFAGGLRWLTGEDRLSDPSKHWKLSPMDLESRRRWVDYSRAKDVMFARTDTKLSPWWVVEADVKRHARLNTIRHLLSSIPYEYEPKPPLKLPKRQDDPKYVRPPRETMRYVPEVY